MAGELYVAGPRAALSATPAAVQPDARVTLDARRTELVGYPGAGVVYEFDPEGDGSFMPARASPLQVVSYPKAGRKRARVRATDQAGRSDIATATVVVGACVRRPSVRTLTTMTSTKRCADRLRGRSARVRVNGRTVRRVARVGRRVTIRVKSLPLRAPEGPGRADGGRRRRAVADRALPDLCRPLSAGVVAGRGDHQRADSEVHE